MSKEIVVSEADKIAAIIEDNRVSEFFLSEGEQFVGDIVLASVESIVPAIEAAFLDIGRERSGFIHVSDIPASKRRQSGIRHYLRPKQSLLVQVTKEPTGNKGACVSGFIALPGRFLVLTPFERRIGLSKKIYDSRERARLARIARVICGAGYGIVLRTEAAGQSEQALREDLNLLLDRWKRILKESQKSSPPASLYTDQDILERVLRDGLTPDVSRVTLDTRATYDRAVRFLQNWPADNIRTKLRVYNGASPILQNYGIYHTLESSLQTVVPLPSGGTLVIEDTEALTVVDINSGSMTSEDSQSETILKTNLEAAIEIAHQLVLRDIGGVVVIDFIDMDNPRDQQVVWQTFSDALKTDRSQPQINYFSEFGLVEMTRRRQRQSLSELLTEGCPTCQGTGRIRNSLYRADLLTTDGTKIRFIDSKRGWTNTSSASLERQSRRVKNRGKSAPVEIDEVAFEPAPERKRSSQQQSRTTPTPQPKEKLEDFLFDESYLTSPLENKQLDTYVEKEEALVVSDEASSYLDGLVAQIKEKGIASIKDSKKKQNEVAEPEVHVEPTEVLLDDFIESEEGSGKSEAEPVEAEKSVSEGSAESESAEQDASTAVDESESAKSDAAEVKEVEEPPKAKAAKGKATKASKTTKKAKAKTTKASSAKAKAAAAAEAEATEEVVVESVPVDAVEAEEAVVETPAEESTDSSTPAETDSASEEASESAEDEEKKETTKGRSKTTRRKSKSLAGRRRSIRSFKPKK